MPESRKKNNNFVMKVVILILLVSLINVANGEEDNYNFLWSYDTNSWIGGVAVSSNGSFTAVGANDAVYLFNKKGNILWNYKTVGVVNGVSISSNGSNILVGSTDNYIYFFENNGNLSWSRKLSYYVNAVSLTPDGSLIVAGTEASDIYLFSKEGDLLWESSVKEDINSIAISPDGSYIAVGTDNGYVNIYYKGKLINSFKPAKEHVRGVSFFYDNSLAVGTDDYNIHFYNKDGKSLWEIKRDKKVGTISTSNSSYILAGCDDEYIYLLNRNGQLIWNYKLGHPVKSVSISSNGSHIVAGSRKVYFFELVNSNFTTLSSSSNNSKSSNTNWIFISLFASSILILIIMLAKSRNNIQIKRGYEILQNNDIRFGIRVKNNTNHVILDVEAVPKFNTALFQLKGERVKNVGYIKPGSEMTAKYVLKSQSCVHSEKIDAYITYFDYKGKVHKIEVRPLEIHCVYPFLKEKIMQESEFVKLSRNNKHVEEGLFFIGISVNEFVDIIKSWGKNRLYLINDYEIENTRILYLAGESIDEKTYYLLTAVIQPNKNTTQVALRVFSDKSFGLHGFLDEIVVDVRHLVSSIPSVKEIGIIENKQVINIIDSFVQKTHFEKSDGTVEINITGSIIQRSNIGTNENNKK